MDQQAKASVIQIIVVTVDGNQIDSKVQGSHLSVKQYGDAVALVIRNIAALFARNAEVDESSVVEEILRVVDDASRRPSDTDKFSTLQ